MTLLPVLRQLKALEEGITITDPIPLRTTRAYLTVPDRSAPLSTMRAVFENLPIVGGDQDRIGEFREDAESIRIRFTAHDANYDRACEVAMAFYDATRRALDAERPAARRLGGTVDHLMIRPGGIQDFGGRPGFEIGLDYTQHRTVAP